MVGPVPESVSERRSTDLYRYRCANVSASGVLNLFLGGSRISADYVHQGLTNFSGTRTNYLTLFVFENINSASRIEG